MKLEVIMLNEKCEKVQEYDGWFYLYVEYTNQSKNLAKNNNNKTNL